MSESTITSNRIDFMELRDGKLLNTTPKKQKSQRTKAAAVPPPVHTTPYPRRVSYPFITNNEESSTDDEFQFNENDVVDPVDNWDLGSLPLQASTPIQPRTFTPRSSNLQSSRRRLDTQPLLQQQRIQRPLTRSSSNKTPMAPREHVQDNVVSGNSVTSSFITSVFASLATRFNIKSDKALVYLLTFFKICYIPLSLILQLCLFCWKTSKRSSIVVVSCLLLYLVFFTSKPPPHKPKFNEQLINKEFNNYNYLEDTMNEYSQRFQEMLDLLGDRVTTIETTFGLLHETSALWSTIDSAEAKKNPRKYWQNVFENIKSQIQKSLGLVQELEVKQGELETRSVEEFKTIETRLDRVEEKKGDIDEIVKKVAVVLKSETVASVDTREILEELEKFKKEIMEKSLVQNELKQAPAKDDDVTGGVDYCLKSAGARIIRYGGLTSRIYLGDTSKFDSDNSILLRLKKFIWPTLQPIPLTANPPEVLLDSNNSPGRCWAFKGHRGYLTVLLAATIKPTGFSLFHPSVKQWPDLSVAPNEFEVWGLKLEAATREAFKKRFKNFANDDSFLAEIHDRFASTLKQSFADIETKVSIPENLRPKLLVSASYNRELSGSQKWPIDLTSDEIDVIQVRFKSNWGNPSKTCIYQVSINGEFLE